MGKRGLLVVIGVLVVVVVVLVALLAGQKPEEPPEVVPMPTPTPSEMGPEWVTFSRADWGYKIKYPDYLYWREIGEARRLIISDLEEMGIQDVLLEEKIHVGVDILDNPERLGLRDYLEDLMGSSAEGLVAYSQNGMDGYKLEVEHEGGTGGVDFFFGKEDKVYLVMAISYKSLPGSESFVLMRQIMTTFELIGS